MTVAALRPPDGRQGPGPMPGALLRMLDLALVRRAGGTLPGDHLAPGAGAGTELVQLRPYQVGDDVRQIDAAATARTGVPHVRLQVPERTLTTWLVIDVSPSMAFGTARRLKADVAEGVAIAVARLATRRGGRAGLLRAGAGDELLLPPRGGRHAQLAIERAVREGVAADAAASPDALARALVRAGRVARRPGLVVVVSDFREEGWRAPLAALGARHSVVAVEVSDPREAALPSAGHLALVDPETGALVEVDSSRARVRERYAALEAERRESVAAGLRSAGADHVVLDTGHDWLRALGRGFDKRRVTRRPARLRLVPPRARPAMSFAAPLFLLALFALPVGAALHVLAQRRRRRYAVRFPGAPLAALAAPAARALAPSPACGAPRYRGGRARSRAGATGGDGRRPGRAGVRDPRDRHVALDDGDGRRARPAVGRPLGGRAVPRRGAGRAACGRGRVQRLLIRAAAADHRPRAGPRGARGPRRRRRHRHRRRARRGAARARA